MTTEPLNRRQAVILGLILVAALLVRAAYIGRLSYWYDEVVTIRLANANGPVDLLALLNRIDATRAPLHPLILQQWVKVFGASEAASRSLSAVCGVLTVLAVFRLGRLIFRDNATGIWAALLAAISPPLIVYARETRMYAWLVLVTCVAWECLVRLKDSNSVGAAPRSEPASAFEGNTVRTADPTGPLVGFALYAASLVALSYSHPLGLLMAATLAVASIVLGVPWKHMAVTYLVVAICVEPWIAHYLDHAPESTTGRLPLRFLLGTPIGFLGGNFLTLPIFFGLIAFGMTRISREKPSIAFEDIQAAVALMLWLAVPPVLLYMYSAVSHPIFGPARYTLFVAPAFLLLVARGLARLPRWASILAGVAILGLSISLWPSMIFSRDLKADWRAAARYMNSVDPAQVIAVHVVTIGQGPNVEVETARYYLGSKRPVRAYDRETTTFDKPVWVAVGGRENGKVPLSIRASGTAANFDGLRLYLSGNANP